MDDDDRSEQYQEFLVEEYHDRVAALADAYPEQWSLTVDWQDLARWDLVTAKEFLEDPGDEFEALQAALQDYNHGEVDLYTLTLREDLPIEPAVHNLPDDDRYLVGTYRHTEIGRYIEVEGQVTKRTEVNPMLDVVCRVCLRCGTKHYRDVDVTGSGSKVRQCEGCESKGPFMVDQSESEWTDHQLVRVQTPPENVSDGTEKLHVHLTGPLAGAVEGGDRVRIAGEFRAKATEDWPVHDKFLEAGGVYVEDAALEDVAVDGEDVATIEEYASRDDIYALLRQSVAAAHKGDPHLKDAVALQLFGDFTRHGPDGSHHRGKPHILLIGDPGAGKTLLLEGAAHASPRSVFTDGMNSTAAGLTAAMVKDDFGQGDGWSIEAGAVVRAHMGTAAIDELDKADPEDVDSLHTAMASEKVPVAKAGKRAVLPAQTAILAAANPAGGHYDPSRRFEDQVSLASPLLSRFDLVFVVREKQDEGTVREIANHMAQARDAAGYYDRDDLALDPEQREVIEPAIPHDVLTRYIAHATRNYHPVAASEEVLDRVAEEYVDIKMSLPDRYREELDDDDVRSGLPLTPRAQGAIQRLAAASARIRLDDRYTMADVDRAVGLVRRSLRDIGILEGPTGSATASTDDELSIEDVGIGD